MRNEAEPDDGYVKLLDDWPDPSQPGVANGSSYTATIGFSDVAPVERPKPVDEMDLTELRIAEEARKLALRIAVERLTEVRLAIGRLTAGDDARHRWD